MKNLTTIIRFTLVGLFLATLYGCDSQGDETNAGSAQIIGSIASQTVAGKTADECPEAIITINDAPASVVFLEDDGCTFFISDVPVAEEVVIAVELVTEGLTGIIVVQNVLEDELIEIFVEADAGALSLSVLRRVAPLPEGDLPERITENNVEISLGAGLFDQTLTIDGNRVTLSGVAGGDCASEGWTTIGGEVTVRGNKAIFRNIKFWSPVTVTGNKASFINSCFGDVLVSFGNQGDDDDDDDDDDDG